MFSIVCHAETSLSLESVSTNAIDVDVNSSSGSMFICQQSNLWSGCTIHAPTSTSRTPRHIGERVWILFSFQSSTIQPQQQARSRTTWSIDNNNVSPGCGSGTFIKDYRIIDLPYLGRDLSAWGQDACHRRCSGSSLVASAMSQSIIIVFWNCLCCSGASTSRRRALNAGPSSDSRPSGRAVHEVQASRMRSRCCVPTVSTAITT